MKCTMRATPLGMMAMFGAAVLLLGCPDEPTDPPTPPVEEDAGPTPDEDVTGGDASVPEDAGPDAGPALDVVEPDASEDAGTPDTGPLDVDEPDAESPDVEPVDVDAPQPDGDEADTTGQDAEIEDVEAPEVDAPPADVEASEVDAPTTDVEAPEVDQPDVEAPEVDQPDAAVPDVGPPADVEAPDVIEPEVSVPDVEAPEVGQPDVEAPEVTQPDVGPPDAGGPDVVEPPPSQDESQALEFLNHATTTKGVLLGQVGLSGSAPNAILEFKVGPDQEPGTADDGVFLTIDDLDALSGVALKTVNKIIAFARNWTPEILDPVLVLLNGPVSAVELAEQAGLSTKAASNLVDYREGDDGALGTDDDQIFHSRWDVDNVPFVGPATMEALEQHAGLGTQELLGSGTVAHLLSVAFNDVGEALIVGTPLGGDPHILWFTPFGEGSIGGDDPYEFIPIEDVPETMNAAAFSPDGSLAIMVGEAAGLFLFDPFGSSINFVPVSGVDTLTDVVFGPTGTEAYATSPDAGVILQYDVVSESAFEYAAIEVVALAVSQSAAYQLLAVGAGGAASAWDAEGNLTDLTLGTGETLFAAFWGAGGFDIGGELGVAAVAGAGAEGSWTRLPSRTLRDVAAGAVSNDGTWLLLVGSDGLMLRYDLVTGVVAPLTAPVKADLNDVGFADDGTALIVGANGTVIHYTPEPVAP